MNKNNEIYMIVRFYSAEGRKNRIVKKGLTLQEAQEHCSKESTHKIDVWFDGYTLQDKMR